MSCLGFILLGPFVCKHQEKIRRLTSGNVDDKQKTEGRCLHKGSQKIAILFHLFNSTKYN